MACAQTSDICCLQSLLSFLFIKKYFNGKQKRLYSIEEISLMGAHAHNCVLLVLTALSPEEFLYFFI